MESESPLVSVIIPCYNSERFLQETLDSVYGQSYSNIEIICVDNGSTDGTVSLIKENQTDHPNLYFYQELEKGASRARNLGLKNSNGVFIQFLDSDDIITPDKFEKQIMFAVSQNLEVVVSDRTVKDQALQKLEATYTFSGIEKKPIETAISEIIITGNPIYKKSVVMKVGGYTPELLVAQDWDFHIKLFLSRPKIGYLKGDFLICRNVGSSLSSNWLQVAEVSCELLQKYHSTFNQDIKSNIVVLEKVVNTLFVTAIFTDSKTYSKKLANQLLIWVDKTQVPKYLVGFNKFLVRVFGIRTTIKFKRFLKQGQI